MKFTFGAFGYSFNTLLTNDKRIHVCISCVLWLFCIFYFLFIKKKLNLLKDFIFCPITNYNLDLITHLQILYSVNTYVELWPCTFLLLMSTFSFYFGKVVEKVLCQSKDFFSGQRKSQYLDWGLLVDQVFRWPKNDYLYILIGLDFFLSLWHERIPNALMQLIWARWIEVWSSIRNTLMLPGKKNSIDGISWSFRIFR